MEKVADFHCPHRRCGDAGLCLYTTPEGGEDPSSTPALSQGKELTGVVGESFTLGMEGYWESQEGGPGASGCNPYADAVLVVVEEGSGGTGSTRKVRHFVCKFVFLAACLPACKGTVWVHRCDC